MQGIVIPVLHKMELNYGFLSGTTNENTYTVANAVSVAGYSRIGLSVRVHALDVSGGNAFSFEVEQVSPSDEDGRDFVLSTGTGSTGTISGTAPFLAELSSVLTDPQTPFVRVNLIGVGNASGGTFYGQFSADLKLWMA